MEQSIHWNYPSSRIVHSVRHDSRGPDSTNLREQLIDEREASVNAELIISSMETELLHTKEILKELVDENYVLTRKFQIAQLEIMRLNICLGKQTMCGENEKASVVADLDKSYTSLADTNNLLATAKQHLSRFRRDDFLARDAGMIPFKRV